MLILKEKELLYALNDAKTQLHNASKVDLFIYVTDREIITDLNLIDFVHKIHNLRMNRT